MRVDVTARGSGGDVQACEVARRGRRLELSALVSTTWSSCTARPRHLIYPMDLLISGKPELVARARAAMASRLTTSAAHLTVSAEAQAVEDRLTTLGTRSDENDDPPRFNAAAAAAFAEIDDTLATIMIPYEEWEVLYRQRLQVERDLRAGAMAGEAVLGADARHGWPAGDADGVRAAAPRGAEAALTWRPTSAPPRPLATLAPSASPPRQRPAITAVRGSGAGGSGHHRRFSTDGNSR
jgi:hypothetical protein